MRGYSRLAGVITLMFGLIATLGGVRAAPTRPPTPHASPSPTPISYEGSFLKTMARVPQAPRDWHPVQDKYGRFALAVPSEWSEGATPPDEQGPEGMMLYALVAYDTQPRENFSTNLIVSQTQVSPKFELKPKMVSGLAATMTSTLGQYHFVVKDKAFTTLDGTPCIIIGGVLTIQDSQRRLLQLQMVHREVKYIFTFTALDKYYTQYEPLFARLIKTVAFEREQPSPSPSSVPASPTPSPRHS